MKGCLYYFCLVSFLFFHTTRGSGSTKTNSRNINSVHFDHELFSQNMSDLQDFESAPRITSSSRTSKPDSYLLSWEPNSIVSNVQSFKIRFKKTSDKIWSYRTVSSSKSELLLTSLDSSSVYEVEMICLSSQNKSSRLAMSTFRTGAVKKKSSDSISSLPTVSPSDDDKSKNKSGQAPGAPSIPHVVVTSPTSVSLTWLPRSNGGSPITGYKVQVRLMGGKRNKWKTKKKLPADIKTFNVEDLKRDSSYKFRIIAINANGESAPSPISIRSPVSDSTWISILKIAPDVTVELLNNGSVLIRWTYEITDPSLIDGYILKYTVGGESERKKLRDPNVMSYQIENPVHQKEYSVYVQAFKANNKSPRSYPIQFKVIRDHAKKKDVLKTKCLYCVPKSPIPSIFDGDKSGTSTDPDYNKEVKTTSSQRDIAIIIAGSVLALVIFILLVSCKIYHMQKKRNKFLNHAGGGATQNEPSNLCTKLFGTMCNHPETPASTDHSALPQSSSCQCSCYSGTSSPVRTGASCLQSNRTSMSHNAIPENGIVAYPRMHGNPMYTVYYDYTCSRPPPPCVTTSGIPICWIRGEGEFCHIIPHDSRPKAIEEMAQKEEKGNALEVTTTRTPSEHRSSSHNDTNTESSDGIRPEQVKLLESRDTDNVVDET